VTTTLDLLRAGPAGGLVCSFCLTPWRAENGTWYRFDTPGFSYPFGGGPAVTVTAWTACPDCSRAAQQYTWHAMSVAAADRWLTRWGPCGWLRGELEHALGQMYGALNAHLRPPTPFVPGQTPAGATA
jgi:hypothetical protein